MGSLRDLPKVDTLSRSPALAAFPEPVRRQAARAAVQTLRGRVLAGEEISPGEAEALAAGEASRRTEQSMARVINASGVVLHTGLGRARLAKAAQEAIAAVAGSHAALEIDLESGLRGDRQEHVRGLLRELTGAEDALVVNNCASAVLLTLSSLCSGREVVLSRGEMVEIGGSFRMPDVVRASGCRLAEVGCTNKTRLTDYSSAIGEETAAILRCHPSNYRIVGFTETPPLADLRRVADEKGVLLLEDLGSGCLVDTTRFGLPKEPTVQEAIAAGADVVTASGDKMLGGPQAGLVLGKSVLIRRIASHPLARVVRIDKLTLAGLEATLRLYASGRQDEIPTLAALGREHSVVRRWAGRIRKAWGPGASIEGGLTEVGGGSAPGVGLLTWRVGIDSKDPETLARRLRTGNPSILGRIEQDRVWLDPRTLTPEEVREVEAVLRGLAKR